MNRRRQMRLARGLLVLTCMLFVAIPASMFVECGIECYGVSLYMSLGAFWFSCYEMQGWNLFFVVTGFMPESWLWPEVREFTTPTVDVYGAPSWIPFATCATLTFFAFRRSRKLPPGHCAKCGYDLTGNVSGRCPECGEPIDAVK